VSIKIFGDREENPSLVIIKDFYNESELTLIWKELEFLTPKLSPPSQTGSAVTPNKTPLKNNKGMFLDYTYNDRNTSDILSIIKRIFEYLPVDDMKRYSSFYSILESNCPSICSTLLSYYENGDDYKIHKDVSVVTIMTYFFKEPKFFSGGDLILSDFDVTIEPENNMIVIIPGLYNHEVSEVVMEEEHSGKNLGRYCLTQFINFKE